MKRRVLFLLLLMASFAPWTAFGQQLTVYDGNSTSRYVPAYIYFFDEFARSQFVIPAADLEDMIGSSITSMTFYTTSDNIPYTTMCLADVYLKEVSYTTISAYEPKASATTVYSGTLSIVSTGSGGEMTISFSTSYLYQGGNLLVGIENTAIGGWKDIYFYGQTINGASIAGNNANSLENVPPTQRNFIPKTTFGYYPSMCEPRSLPYFYGFEDVDELDCWTMLNRQNNTGWDWWDPAHDGEKGFQFHCNSNQPQYLISPEFDDNESMTVSFYYRNYADYNFETFQVGYSTTTKSPNAFTWSDEVTADDANTWMLYEDFFPNGTKYVAVKYTSTNCGKLFLDDFSFSTSYCSEPINLTVTNITPNSAMLNWTGFQDDYDIRYRKKPRFFEDFENGFPSGWTTIDNDGDGYNWFIATDLSSICHSGTHVMASESWHRNGNIALTPDNWLVSPQMELQGTMKVWLRARDTYYLEEHFAIYLSTTGNSVSNFSTVLVPETIVTNGFVGYTADLSAFAGQLGYIAIRHFNCTDMDQLYLDDFCLIDSPDDDGWDMGWTTSNQLFVNYLEPSTEYEWQVRGRNCDGSGTYTDWSAVQDFTTPCETFIVDADHPFFESFEGTTFAPDCWGLFSTGSYSWDRSSGYAHSGSASAFSSYYGDNYLVLPNLELQADALTAQITFWSYNSWLGDFVEGYNKVVLHDGDTETVLWSAETVIQAWEETTIDLSDYLGQTVSLAFKYAGDDGNGWYVDDVEVAVSTKAAFITDGNWNNGSCWNTGYVPPAGSDVVIRANAIVPTGYVAVADDVTLDGGSITVADGGQLKHNIFGLEVTMEKNIVGYNETNSTENYYLINFPFVGGATLPDVMTATEGYDLYKFNSNDVGAEWRNDKQEGYMYANLWDVYLYASPVDMEVSVTGTTLDCHANMEFTVHYFENSGIIFNGWALLGNPYTYSVYVYRRNSDNELEPMSIMMYDADGELQTVYGGPVAPMQGFFVQVTEETTVCFSDASPNDEHAYVDLGLPSGLLWATCNVGANSPEENGDYFAWGETTPKDHYDWYNYQHSNGYSLTKYCNDPENGYNGFVDNMTDLLSEDDAATANWGSDWRMPSVDEWLELIDNTTQTWIPGSGCVFQAPNGNSIFLPAAGYYEGTDFNFEGTNGQYWSSTLYSYYAFLSTFTFIAPDSYHCVSNHRCQGRSIRPVRATAPMDASK